MLWPKAPLVPLLVLQYIASQEEATPLLLLRLHRMQNPTLHFEEPPLALWHRVLDTLEVKRDLFLSDELKRMKGYYITHIYCLSSFHFPYVHQPVFNPRSENFWSSIPIVRVRRSRPCGMPPAVGDLWAFENRPQNHNTNIFVLSCHKSRQVCSQFSR